MSCTICLTPILGRATFRHACRMPHARREPDAPEPGVGLSSLAGRPSAAVRPRLLEDTEAMTATLEPTAKIAAEKGTAPSPADVIRRAREAGVQVVDVRFCDLPGTWQHFSLPLKELTEDVFTEGLGFDGSSIRGFQAINESDMLLFPDAASAFVDPCLQVPTLALVCDVVDPVTGERYSRDPRYVARKAEEYLIKSGVATTAYFGPEAEFYIFNSVRFDQNAHEGYYHI